MESPSTKVPVLFQSMRKLKQATLPFESVKTNSKHDPLFKRQKVDDCSTEDLPMESDCVEIIEVISVKSNEDEKQDFHNKMQEHTPQNISEVQKTEVLNEGSSVNVNEIENKTHQSCGPNILTELTKETGTECMANVPVKENISDQNINLANTKRKLEGNEQSQGQKPPKRAKLIYHVDKLRINDEKVKESKVEISVSKPTSPDCVINNSKKIVEMKQSPESCKENMKSSALNMKPVDKAFELQSECNTYCINPMDISTNEDVSMSEKDTDEIDKEDGVSPNFKDNGASCGRSSLKKLTPKQLERKAELTRKKKNLQQEKERKKREKEEERVRMKKEREEVKKKLKEEKERKKQAEIELKNDEKRRKEEEKRRKEEQKLEDKRRKEEQRLEDRRKKEELLRKKEEEEELQKKKITKEAEAFSSFFKKYDVRTPVAREDCSSSNEVTFMPFTVKADMRLAPINRNPMDSERLSKFEELYNAQSEEATYLKELTSGVIVPEKRGNTWPLEEKYDEVSIVLDEGLDMKNEVTPVPKKRFGDKRPKLLQFHENRRPPYWGTWRKKSKTIRPKNPLGKDEIFDYEMDSDDEWEEEEPGESLHGSDDEKESEDEYEVDNDFFVPHGYLSDDENHEDDIIPPEIQKAKLKLLGEQFDMERNEKTKLLKPITVGCVWFGSDLDEPTSVNPAVVKFLSKRKAIPWTDTPILLVSEENIDSNEAASADNATANSAKKPSFPEDAIPDLILFIHGSTNSRKKLAKTFPLQRMKKEESKVADSEEITTIPSQAGISRKIKELATWEECSEEGPYYGKRCWCVKKDIREKFGVANLPVGNKVEVSEGKEIDSVKKVSPALITKFTKVLTEDERKNQMSKCNFRRKSVSTPSSSAENTSIRPKLKPLKCVRKLKEFMAKPSLNEKCSVGVSISPQNMEEDVSPVDEENLGVALTDSSF